MTDTPPRSPAPEPRCTVCQGTGHVAKDHNVPAWYGDPRAPAPATPAATPPTLQRTCNNCGHFEGMHRNEKCIACKSIGFHCPVFAPLPEEPPDLVHQAFCDLDQTMRDARLGASLRAALASLPAKCALEIDRDDDAGNYSVVGSSYGDEGRYIDNDATKALAAALLRAQEGT